MTVYAGGWVFGDYVEVTLAALKFDTLENRWGGNLHFPDGTARITLKANSDQRRNIVRPEFFIYQGDTSVGLLFPRVTERRRVVYYGRLNTPVPLAIYGAMSPDNQRLVVTTGNHTLLPPLPKYQCFIHLTPYPAGEKWSPKKRKGVVA